MIGAIIGDLAGSIYEYDQLKEIKPVKMKNIIEENSFYSDDTILTIAVADAIKNDKNYNEYLRKYIEEYKDYKPNFKPYFKSSFSPSLIKWSKTTEVGNSHGNGAIMRISPVGFMFDNEEEVIENSFQATIPSHNSKEAISSAKIVSLIIYYLRNGMSKEEVFDSLNLQVQYRPFTKFNTTCEETLDNCLYSFYNSNSFEDAIERTLYMGGDTDTNCAIVGSMAEAIYPISDNLKEEVNKKLPKKLIKVLKK